MDRVPAGSVALSWVGLVRLCSGSSSVVAPLGVCARLCLLDTLVIVARDFVGVCCVAAGVGFAALGSSIVMQEIRFFRLLFAYSVLATRLIACSIAASTSTSQSDFDSSFSKIFSFPLREGVTFGSFASLSFSSVSPSSYSFSFKPSVFASTSFFFL